jgi:hypothetical protein
MWIVVKDRNLVVVTKVLGWIRIFAVTYRVNRSIVS